MEEDPRLKKRKSHKAGREGEAKKVAVDTSEVGGKKRRENIDRFRPSGVFLLLCHSSLSPQKEEKKDLYAILLYGFHSGENSLENRALPGGGFIGISERGGGGRLKGGLKLNGKVVVVKWGVKGKGFFENLVWTSQQFCSSSCSRANQRM